ncbi:MAG TPA: hypothetical protein VGM17_07330 [Rhizomicrobium sp.]|jgi:hypothetical protein
MLVRAGIVAGLLLGASAVPALAVDSCGSMPIAPALPSAADMLKQPAATAASTKHDAFEDIKNWQRDLKTYRACLASLQDQDKLQLQGKDPTKDADKIKRLKDDMDAQSHGYDQTVDSEERLVNQWNAMSTAYCSRSDVDKSSCPKH